MRVLFMGTPDFAVPSLELLADHHEVVLVVTRPDAVRARGKEQVPSPVALAAERLGLPVAKHSRVTPELMDELRALAPDVACVAAYGCLLPDELLELPRLGCVNVHGSLLPRWRGAAPVQRAVLAGDERVGISIMKLVHEMDAGAYCRQASVPVGESGCEELLAELARIGAQELVAALDEMEAGTCAWTEQDEALVTFAPKVDKREMRLDPDDPAAVNARRVAASSDAAPARLTAAGKGMRALSARVASENVAQGVLSCANGRMLLGCAEGTLELLRVRPDGKRDQDASAWAAGRRGQDVAWGRLA